MLRVVSCTRGFSAWYQFYNDDIEYSDWISWFRVQYGLFHLFPAILYPRHLFILRYLPNISILYYPPSCIPRHLVLPTILYSLPSSPFSCISHHLLFPATIYFPSTFIPRFFLFSAIFPSSLYCIPSVLYSLLTFIPRHLFFFHYLFIPAILYSPPSCIQYPIQRFHFPFNSCIVHAEQCTPWVGRKKFNNERPHCNTWTGKPWINRIQGNTLE